MRLSQLLNARQHLLRCTHLANLAFAHRLLGEYAARIERAQLHGVVNLRCPEANEEACWAALTALEINQSLIEEHFTDEDLMDLTDAISYITDEELVDVTFRIEDFATVFLLPLREALEDSGIQIDDAPPAVHESNAEESS